MYSKPDSSIDVVIVIGSDRDYEDTNKEFLKTLEDHCVKKGLTYSIVGNGKKNITIDSCKTLPKSRTLILAAHGEVKQDAHFIDNLNTLEFIQKAQCRLQCKNVIIRSCFSGKVIDDIHKNDQKLLDGTCIVASSAKNELTYNITGNQLVEDCIAKIKPGTKLKMIEFVGNAIKTIPETLVIGLQLKDVFLSEALLREARGLNKVYLNVKELCEYQTTIFNNFIDNSLLHDNSSSLLDRLNDEFQDYAHKTTVLPFSMTQEEENTFQDLSLITHIFQNDVDIMENVLSKNEFEPTLLACAISSSSSRDSKSLSTMIDVILKHKNNAKYGMNENAFCPKATIYDYHRFYKKHGALAVLGALSYTPLTLALNLNQVNSIEILLKHGADIYLRDNKGTLPATLLDHEKYKPLFIKPLKKATQICQCIKIISAHIPENVDYSKYPSFQISFNEILKKQEAFELICQRENDIDFLQLKTNLPKNSIVYKAYQDFISSTNNINPRDILNFTVDNELKTELGDLLKSKKLYSSFYKAIINNDLELVKAYLYKGSISNTTYANGLTTLSLAVAMEHTEIVIELLKNNFDLTETSFQITFLQIASRHVNSVLKQKLLDCGICENTNPNVSNELFRFAAKNDISGQEINALVNWNTDINSLDTKGKAAIHYCVENGHLDFVRSLYHWKANLDLRDSEGRSALQLASMKCKEESTSESQRRDNYIPIIRALIRGGAKFHLDPDVLSGLNLSNASFVANNFSDINLSGTNFTGTNFEDAIFTNAILTGVDFTSVKNLEVEQLITAKTIRDVIIDLDYLKKLNHKQLAQLTNKSLQDYKTFMADQTVKSVVTTLLSIINNETHLLKYRFGSFSPGYGNSSAYETVIECGKDRILTLLQDQNSKQELSNTLQEKLKTIFETKTDSIERNINTFFSPSGEKQSKLETLNLILKEQNPPPTLIDDRRGTKNT